MEAPPRMTTDEPTSAGTSPETDLAQTLGKWVASLGLDALSVAELSQQFSPGAPVRAPLRAGLRHLLHIAPLCHWIEALAMLEVAIMLRVTALLASPAEELGSETILQLRADTRLIEELFPEESEAIWHFCNGLISNERLLPSEQLLEAAVLEKVPTPDEVSTDDLQADIASPYVESAPSKDSDSPSSDNEAAALDAPSDPAQNEGEADEGEAPPLQLESAPLAPADELVDKIRAWASSYGAPQFGHHPYDLTRAQAFVRTRVSAWSGV